MTKKILVIGTVGTGKTTALKQLAEKHGSDLQVFTPKEAAQKGINPDQFVNMPTHEFLLPKQTQYLEQHTTGKENRRQRRKNNRKK